MSVVAGVDFSGLQRAVDQACAMIDKLRGVAEAAKALAEDTADFGEYTVVREAKLVALESALEAAGYGMTEEEFDRRMRQGMRTLADRGELP